MTVPFMDNFRSLSNKFPAILGEPKIFGFKNVMARGIRRILIFVMRQISSENFRENNTQALEVQRRLNDWTDTNSIAPLRNYAFLEI